MKCEEVTGSIVALLDGELGPDERAAIEAHLASCAACRGELQRVRATQAVVGRHLAAASVTAGSFDDLWRRIEHGDGPATAAGAGGAVVRDLAAARRAAGGSRGGTRGRRLPAWAALGGLAAAAGLALVVLGRQASDERVGAPPASPPMVVARDAGEARRSGDAAPQRKVAAKPAAEKRTQSAKAEPAPAPDRDPARDPAEDEEAIAAVALNEADPPRELLERPDLFLDFPIVRKLDELRHLDAVLAESPAANGGAG